MRSGDELFDLSRLALEPDPLLLFTKVETQRLKLFFGSLYLQLGILCLHVAFAPDEVSADQAASSEKESADHKIGQAAGLTVDEGK